MASLITDFFGDVVCCWCFNISSRMRGLADKLDIDGRHRAFILRASRAEVAARWESPKNARKTILGHWPVCPQGGNRTELVDIDAMRAAPFDFSRAMTAALGCKAAELLGGQATHWDMFDRLQRAHLTEARNMRTQGSCFALRKSWASMKQPLLWPWAALPQTALSRLIGTTLAHFRSAPSPPSFSAKPALGSQTDPCKIWLPSCALPSVLSPERKGHDNLLASHKNPQPAAHPSQRALRPASSLDARSRSRSLAEPIVPTLSTALVSQSRRQTDVADN